LVSVYLSEFILAAVLRSAALCIRLRNILRKWFVTTITLARDVVLTKKCGPYPKTSHFKTASNSF